MARAGEGMAVKGAHCQGDDGQTPEAERPMASLDRSPRRRSRRLAAEELQRRRLQELVVVLPGEEVIALRNDDDLLAARGRGVLVEQDSGVLADHLVLLADQDDELAGEPREPGKD